jgi:ferredoxin
MMKWAIAEKCTLDDVLDAVTGNRVLFALVEEDRNYRLVRADRWEPHKHTLGAYRQIEPLKALLFRPREYLGAWTGQTDREPMAERIVIGVKNCDLSGLAIHDDVFLNGDIQDPLYAEAREKTILVTADCTGCREVCFCPAVGEHPYPTQHFDINISPTPMGYLLETGTDRGADVLQAARQYLTPADDAIQEARQSQRAKMDQKLVENAASAGLAPGMDFRGALEETFESPMWDDFAADCVECGACNFICCTCHCFMLADGLNTRDNPARCKQWDSCLFPGFACTAGGNPRPKRAQRLRNRFDKKFIFFPDVLGRYACDGCGRCTEACIGKIDIRKILKRAVNESGAIHADSSDD